jgi:REP element-mobilizing transposase RayT/transcriptional regulator
MIRGIEGAKIFHDDIDRENFLSRVGKLVESTGTRILAWALMNNHVHLLLFSGQSGIFTFMRRLLTGYGVWLNRKHQRSGHLFQNRYKSIVCEEDPYLLELVRYIHLNPLRVSVVKSIDELDHYRWSGHSVLVGNSRNDWQEKEYVLCQFGSGKKRAMRAYRKFMEEGKKLGRRPELVGGGLIRSLGGWSKVLSLREKGEKLEHDSRVLGSGDFVEAMIREADEKMARQMRYRERKTSIEEVVGRMCREEGVREEELKRGGQRRRASEVRRKVAYYLSREMGISMAEIARRLGVGTSAIAMAIRKEEGIKKN